MSPDTLVNRLVMIMQSQEAETALKAIEDAVRDAAVPDPRILLLLAGQYASLGRMDSAEATYTGLLQIAPDFAIARFQLGLLQLTSGRPALAMVSWGALEQLPSDHYLRAFVQGFWHLARDEFVEAHQNLRDGMNRNSENHPLNRDMQMVLDSIEAQWSGAPQTSTELAPAATDDEASVNHVLLSGYTRLH